MKKFCMLLLLLLAHSARAQAPVDVLIEVDRGRTESFFSSKPVVQR